MIYSKILGTGSYLPDFIFTNHDLAAHLETSHDWILERSGIHQRHLMLDPWNPNRRSGSSVTHMAKEASLRAIKAADIDAQEIDLIVFATIQGDFEFPSSACLLQAELDLYRRAIPAFDVKAVCSGFVYALSIADQYIKTGAAKKVLVVGSEGMSKILDWTDRSTCVLFGDGAGAVILGASEEPGLISTHNHADGRFKDYLFMDLSCSKTGGFLKMQGKETFKAAVNALESMFKETLESAGIHSGEIDWLVPHQANVRIIELMAKKLDLSMDQVALTIADHANTSAASIPQALDKYIREGKIKRGQTLLFEAFGGGLTWGSALLKY